MKISFLKCLLFFLVGILSGHTQLQYQSPDKNILDLVDVPLAPQVLKDRDNTTLIFLYRPAYKSIQELSEKELRLGGLRVNPKTYSYSRATYYDNVAVMSIDKGDKKAENVKGLPENARLSNFRFSPDQSKIAMTHNTGNQLELWVLDLKTGVAKRVSDVALNASLGNVMHWFKDSKSLLVKCLSDEKKTLIDASASIPTGPTVTENFGKKAQNRTYQDLLKNPTDEFNFEQLAFSNLKKIDLDGNSSLWLDDQMYGAIRFSPDGNYVMVTRLSKPFSYIVPYRRFPTTVSVYTKDGGLVKTVNETPLLEELPKGFMAVKTGKRNISWRADHPATLYYVMALDEGNPANSVEYRDQLFQWKVPFNNEATALFKTKNRFNGIYWGNATTAVIRDYWWNTRNSKSYVFNPADASQTPVVINDRNIQDVYSDPGDFVMTENEMGYEVLEINKNQLFYIGDGFTDEGQFPFVDALDLKSFEKERLYTSSYTDKYEAIQDYMVSENKLMVRIESKDDYPNVYFRSLSDQNLTQLTSFENPFLALKTVEKELISYKRADGLDLSGTLYLPVGYDKSTKEKMPMILWAYPREYKDKKSAAQKTVNPNRFTYPSWGSPIYWVTQGYVVLDRAAFPIVGEGDNEPNDTFRTQLVANGKAAIDAVDALGYIDRDRVAVGGHSYGAFMVANLLSHSDLFAAGIARSGAYNRTLTPFGFQREERSYWEAPEVYYNMSPFIHADKMKTPLLLVHGEADNNSGTYPMQSIRYFNALKGLGAVTRLVMFPKESHGYRAKETILHLLWEQDQWLNKYVKAPKKPMLNKEQTKPKG